MFLNKNHCSKKNEFSTNQIHCSFKDFGWTHLPHLQISNLLIFVCRKKRFSIFLYSIFFTFFKIQCAGETTELRINHQKLNKNEEKTYLAQNTDKSSCIRWGEAGEFDLNEAGMHYNYTTKYQIITKLLISNDGILTYSIFPWKRKKWNLMSLVLASGRARAPFFREIESDATTTTTYSASAAGSILHKAYHNIKSKYILLRV